MELTNPAVSSGVHLFINIVIILIAFAKALSVVDFKREKEKGE